jgi:hypothetical protein
MELPDLDPTLASLSERIDSELTLKEAFDRLHAAVRDNPEATAALHEAIAALYRWAQAPSD